MAQRGAKWPGRGVQDDGPRWLQWVPDLPRRLPQSIKTLHKIVRRASWSPPARSKRKSPSQEAPRVPKSPNKYARQDKNTWGSGHEGVVLVVVVVAGVAAHTASCSPKTYMGCLGQNLRRIRRSSCGDRTRKFGRRRRRRGLAGKPPERQERNRGFKKGFRKGNESHWCFLSSPSSSGHLFRTC